jgi:peptidoglycan L-alanyl-D-glutamate endopeptidase CwlK
MNKLAGVHPKLVARIERVLAAMEALGHPMMVTDGVRTDEEQAALFKQGRTTPGPNVRQGKPLGNTVTNADGKTNRSNHQLHADGTGHAVDCTFIGLDGKPRWIDSDPWAAYGACAKALGLKWGGDWKARKDRPHVELPPT